MTDADIQRSTGAASGGIVDYSDPAARTATRTISLSPDYLRSQIDSVGGEVREIQVEVRELHDAARERELNTRTVEKCKKSVGSLLRELTAERGMGWSDVAEVVGVSVSAIRKWRNGGDASPESRRSLARIAALLDLLEQKALVQDPASWMEVDLPIETGYFIRPLDLYLGGQATALLEIAEQRRSMAEVLDEAWPQWRNSRSEFEVFTDTDGERSIRLRGE